MKRTAMKKKLWSALFAVVFAAACATTEEAKKPEPTPDQQAQTQTQQPPAEPAKPVDAEPWRTKPPEPGKNPDLVIPTFQKAVMSNGLTVLVSERHDVPLVSMAVAFAAGSAQDPDGKAGIAELTYDTLLEGAGKLDAIALEQAFADLGTEAGTATRPDGAFLGARVLTTNAPKALALMADVVQKPTFKPAAFEQKKSEQLRNLAQAVGSPGYLAQWAFANVLYGPKHPYGQLTGGTPESVAKLTLTDAKAYWKKWSGPKAAALIFTGDVTLDQAKQWAQQYFGGWKGAGTRPPKPPEVQSDGKMQVVLVPKPGMVQTIIAMGRPSIEAGHPDEAALELASTIFGGFFGSRLNMNLREDKGYSYGAGAYVDPRRGEGPLVASSQVKADVTGPAVTEFMNELKGLKTKPITQQELSAAREGLVQGLPGSFATSGDLMNAAATIYWEDKALDHYNKLVEDLRKATPEQVQAAAEKYFDPSTLDVVLVGDPKVVEQQVKPLGIGAFEVRQPPAAGKPPKPAP